MQRDRCNRFIKLVGAAGRDLVAGSRVSFVPVGDGAYRAVLRTAASV